MRAEHSIPLFLWVAAAVVAHAVFGGGASEVGQVLSERIDVESFVREVTKTASRGAKTTEIEIFDAKEEVAPEPEPEEEKDDDDAEPAKDDPKDAEPTPKPEAKKEEPKKPEPKKEEPKKPEPKKPDLLPSEPQKLVVQPPAPDRRVAIKQNVKPNQEDNPNARQIADQANKVEEETVAKNTSTDRNDAEPSPPRPHSGDEKRPGDSENSRVGAAEETKGDKDARDEAARAAQEAREARAAQAQSPKSNATKFQDATKNQPKSDPSKGREARAEVTERPDTLRSPGGSEAFSMAGPRAAQKAQKAQKKLPPIKRGRDSELLGYGSTGVTARGVNLNLSPSDAMAVVGQEKIAETKRALKEKRLAEHRGSFSNLGREKWKAALENYVATAKPGNQTALNAAQVPFASYLNDIHQRIHPIFAEDFLGSLSSLPADHPLNKMGMSTHVEVALDPADGRIVKMGITQSSGVSAFDVGALESIEKASPFGPAPGAILSSDGKVYLHWEFHREPEMACSTFFARPLILKLPPTEAPPTVTPPPAKTEEGENRTGENQDRKAPRG